MIFLIKKPSLPNTTYVPAERHVGTTGQRTLLEETLLELAEGTTVREKRAGCASYFDNTGPRVLRDLALEGNELTIDFDGDSIFALGATAATSMFLGQLTRTIFQFPEVRSIRLELDGSCKKFGVELQTGRCETLRREERG